MAGQSNEDPTMHLVVYVAVFLGIGWLIWSLFKVEILQFLRYFRLAELWFIGLFDSGARACFNWLKVAQVGNAAPSLEAIQAATACYGKGNLTQMSPSEAIQYYNVSSESISVMKLLANRFFRWLTVLTCIAVGVYATYFTPRSKFKTRHTLESLIKIQAKMWPVITPIVNFIPTRSSARIPGDQIPDKLPVFAEALSPEEWVSWHRIPVVNGIPDREMARRAFTQQLGVPWKGTTKNMPPHFLALFAAFALRGVQKREESDDLLGRLALCWTPEGGLVMPLKLSVEVRRIANDPAIGGVALDVASHYAFATTALLGILKWARFAGGVLAPAQFLWLRGVDRNLWYPLNNLGRRAFLSEGAGALAHFMAEETAKKPLPIPRVDTAIVALNQYMAAASPKIPSREEPRANLGRPTATLNLNGSQG